MDLSYSTKNLFPIIIHCFDINGFEQIQNQLIDYSYELKKKNPVGEVFSNRGGWQSSCMDVKNDGDILQQFLINCVGGIPSIDESTSIHMASWININCTNSYNIKHNHPGSHLAGVLWLKCPEKCGNIIFNNPYDFTGVGELQAYTQDFKKEKNFYHSYWFPPTEGRILIFPAHLEHHVEPNESKEDRISVSFNIFLRKTTDTGPLGWL